MVVSLGSEAGVSGRENEVKFGLRVGLVSLRYP